MSAPLVREATADDHGPVTAIIETAFGRPDEARLVDRLRQDGAVILELVAEDGDTTVGHVLFSRLAVGGDSLKATALAPVSVLPSHQRHGMGGAMIRTGLARLRDAGEDICFVLGQPDYYRRFGFDATLGARFSSPWEGPYFMALALRELDLGSLRGRVAYARPFLEPS